MDYKQKYGDALDRAKMFHSHMVSDGIRCAIEEIFPELKESEDETVRKRLIEFFKDWGKTRSHCWSISVSDILAWLEKQGEKPQGKTALEAINEEKVDNANKVEPKFHEGEWITNGYYTWKIVEVKPLDYILQSQDGNIVDDTISYVDALFDSFTIQDAKDGDVLYLQHDGKEHIIIYKGIIKERFRTFVSAYCAYNGIVHAFCFADVSRYADIAYGGIMPATKEQRDLLFAKMKEAGYEWDAEKKELRKIEQKSTWSAEDERIRQCLILDQEEALDDVCNDKCGHSEIISDLKEMYRERINWLKSIKKRIGEKNEHTNLHD